MIVGNAGKLLDQPLHEVDADRRDLARGRAGEERLPALWIPVEDFDAQMFEV
jgi:hypothetical protein